MVSHDDNGPLGYLYENVTTQCTISTRYTSRPCNFNLSNLRRTVIKNIGISGGCAIFYLYRQTIKYREQIYEHN